MWYTLPLLFMNHPRPTLKLNFEPRFILTPKYVLVTVKDQTLKDTDDTKLRRVNLRIAHPMNGEEEGYFIRDTSPNYSRDLLTLWKSKSLLDLLGIYDDLGFDIFNHVLCLQFTSNDAYNDYI